ncbi:class I SAM-dependent methyltransferase [Desulfonauticus submarinus]
MIQNIQKYSLNELIQVAEKKYPLTFEPVKIGGISLSILQIKDLESYIDKLAQTQEQIELPFWAKIWPASVLLTHFLLKHLSTNSNKTVLEIGAGLGLCGLFLAKKGFKVILSDIEPDALLFMQINILKNKLDKNAEVKKIDFIESQKIEPVDYIIGSEVLYLEHSYRPLVKFLSKNLKAKKENEVILSQSYTRKSSHFFDLAKKEFHIQQKTIGYKSQDDTDNEKFLCNIFRLKLKKYV